MKSNERVTIKLRWGTFIFLNKDLVFKLVVHVN